MRRDGKLRSESDAIGIMPAMTTLWDFETQTGWVIDDDGQRIAPLDLQTAPMARASVALDLGLGLTDDGVLLVPDPVFEPSVSRVPGKTIEGSKVLGAVRLRSSGSADHAFELWFVEGSGLTSTDYANAWRRRLPAPRTEDEERLLAAIEALPGYPAVVRTQRPGITVTHTIVSADTARVNASSFSLPPDYERVERGIDLVLSLQRNVSSVGEDDGARDNAGWRELSPRLGDELHFYLYFQDETSLWQCEDKACRAVHGRDEGRTVALPCMAATHHTDFASPSKSGRWLTLGCEASVHLVDMRSGQARATKLDRESWYAGGVVDDDGTMTISVDGAKLVRIPLVGAARHYDVTPPKLNNGGNVHALPALAPWLGFSEGAYSKEVAWRPGRPPKQIALGGGAFFNGGRAWVSLMTGAYVELTPDGDKKPVTGRFGGGLGGKGLLMNVLPWGEQGLIIAYEQAIQLKDPQLETVQTLDLPKMDGMLHVGSNPKGSQLHAASPYGAIYVHGLAKDAVERATPAG